MEYIIGIAVLAFVIAGWGLFLGKEDKEQAKKDLPMVFFALLILIPILAILMD